MKKYLALLLAVVMVFAMAACGAKKEESNVASDGNLIEEKVPSATSGDMKPEKEPEFEKGEFKIAALKGPTAMGLSKLMDDAAKGEELMNDYTFQLAGSADEVTPLLIKGELDMACVPANLAAVLNSKTEGKVQVLAINTLGVIYIVDTDGSVQSVEDLKGKTVVAAGQGSTPEYGLRYILSQNGIDADKDLDIQWKSEHAECVAALKTGAASVAMLPQPFVTVAGNQIEGLNIALDLTEEWDKLDNGSSMITGVIVARKDAVAANPNAVEAFLEEYAASVEFVNSHVDEAAAIIGGLDIVAEPVAKKAIPYCNIVCITGSEMQTKLSGYYQALFDQNPASVGGKVPEGDFFYN